MRAKSRFVSFRSKAAVAVFAVGLLIAPAFVLGGETGGPEEAPCGTSYDIVRPDPNDPPDGTIIGHKAGEVSEPWEIDSEMPEYHNVKIHEDIEDYYTPDHQWFSWPWHSDCSGN